MKILNLDNPFYKPLWIRVAVVAACAGWGLFELSNGAMGWAALFIALAVMCGWRFATIDYSDITEE